MSLPCEVVEKAWTILENDVHKGTLAHAYLFSGSLDQGYQLAIKMACAMNCQIHPGVGCNECALCLKIKRETWVDWMCIKPSGKGNAIKMEDVLSLQEAVQVKPIEGRKRIVLIWDIQKIEKEAANAFLKTLEEPPADSLFILLAHHVHGVLPTIVSRCRRVFVGSDEWDQMLQKSIQDEEIKVIRDKIWQALEQRACAQGLFVDEISDYVHQLKSEQRGNKEFLEEILNIVQTLVRDIQVYWALGEGVSENLMINRDRAKAIPLIAAQVSQESLENVAQALVELRQNLNYNMNLKVSLSRLFSELEWI